MSRGRHDCTPLRTGDTLLRAKAGGKAKELTARSHWWCLHQLVMAGLVPLLPLTSEKRKVNAQKTQVMYLRSHGGPAFPLQICITSLLPNPLYLQSYHTHSIH